MTADKTTTTYNVSIPKDASDEKLNEIISKLKGKVCPYAGVLGPDGKPIVGPDGKPTVPPIPNLIGLDENMAAKKAAVDIANHQERSKADAEISEEKRKAADEIKREAL